MRTFIKLTPGWLSGLGRVGASIQNWQHRVCFYGLDYVDEIATATTTTTTTTIVVGRSKFYCVFGLLPKRSPDKGHVFRMMPLRCCGGSLWREGSLRDPCVGGSLETVDSWLALATRQFKDQGIREWCVGDTVDTNRGVSSRKHRVIPLGKKKTVPCYIQTLYYKHRFSWHNPKPGTTQPLL